jgi:hypothetical protein
MIGNSTILEIFGMTTLTFSQSLKIIKARTGSGKSTDMTWKLFEQNGPLLSVQPRVQNATGISAWMNQTGRLSGCITGARKAPTNQLDYCTTGTAFKLIQSGIYNTVVFDEIQDATAESLNLLIVAKKRIPNIVIMSATIPKWCYKLVEKVEIYPSQSKKYQVKSTFNVTLSEVLNGSDKVPFKHTLENILQSGNALIFVNGVDDLDEIRDLYGYEIDCILHQTNSTQLVVFRGTDDSSKMIKQIRDNEFPQKGILIISNVSLGTGVTIPNLKLIWDKGKVLRTHSQLNEFNYSVLKWFDGLTKQEAYQRSSRGGRTCESNYYCGLESIKLRDELSFPFDYRELDICEVASYLDYQNRIEYFQFLRDLDLISIDNDLECRLGQKLGELKVPKIFDGYNLFTNLKSPNMSKLWNYKRMINCIILESKHRYTFDQIEQMIRNEDKLTEIQFADYCPIQNRVYMLIGQVRCYLTKK